MEANEQSAFGALLRRYRAAAGLSQEALAERARLSRRGIADLERGARTYPYAETVRRLADALGLQPIERAFLLAAAQRPSAPPLVRSPLPIDPSGLVGREREVSELQLLLRSCRILTLTGTAGIGKTRLAVETASRVEHHFPDGVAVVDLAHLTDPGLVGQAVALAIGVQEHKHESVLQTLTQEFGARQLLLLLDNCEHLLDACAALADTLVRACPSLRILATSREAMRIRGETVWLVPSLRPAEASELFVQRARAARATLEWSDTDGSLVGSICRQLDRIPLAIELAAARVPTLGLAQVASRLNERLRLLSGGRRLGSPRHQTLRAAIDWSYTLLRSRERILLGRLSVFAGGWNLDAIDPVCSWDAEDPDDDLAALVALVEKSLVMADQRGGQVRYRFLETIREYAVERLQVAQQSHAVRCRHVDYFLAMSEESEPHLLGPQQSEWLRKLDGEYDNLRAALRWYVARSEAEKAQRLGASLSHYWYLRGHWTEGRTYLNAAIALCQTALCGLSPSQAVARAKACHSAGYLAWRQGDYAVARPLYEESLTLFRCLDDRRGIGAVITGMGDLAKEQGDFMAAEALFEESLTFFRALGDRWTIAMALTNLGEVAEARGDFVKARSLLRESLARFRELGDQWGTAVAIKDLGEVAQHCGDFVKARSLFEESLSIFASLGEHQKIAAILYNLGVVAQQGNDAPLARSLFVQSLQLFQHLEDRAGVACALDGLAQAAAIERDAVRGLRLAGAADVLRDASGTRPRPVQLEYNERVLRAAESTLSNQQRSTAWAEGRALRLQDAIAYALGEVWPTE